MQGARLDAKAPKDHPPPVAIILLALALILAARNPAPATEIATPTLLSYRDALDIALVHDAVMDRIDETRANHGREPLVWDGALQGPAEGRAWGYRYEAGTGHRTV